MELKTIYLLKVNGLNGKHDYLQVRDSNYTLIANVKCVPPYASLQRVLANETTFFKLKNVIETIQYGELTKVEV